MIESVITRIGKKAMMPKQMKVTVFSLTRPAVPTPSAARAACA